MTETQGWRIHMREKQITKTWLWVSAFVLFSIAFMQVQFAYASNAITIAEVDYENEEVVINNNGNTKILFATEAEAGKDVWEQINVDPAVADPANPDKPIDVTRIDFSWLSKTMDNTLVFRGGDDTTMTHRRVEIARRPMKLDISINYTNISALAKTDTIASLVNIMSSAGTGKEPIHFVDLEWRKGDSGKWKSIDELTVTQLEKLQVKGADLYFRLKPVNDITDTTNPTNIKYPDGLKGRRASNETKLKIAKKQPSMVVGIDGSKFTAAIKYGKEYRVTTEGQRSNWNKVDNRAVKDVALTDIVGNLITDTTKMGITEPFPSMKLEIRSYATTKAAASKITEIMLEKQRVLNQDLVINDFAPKNSPTTDPSIYIAYTGNKDVSITIPSASSSNAYEYTVVQPDPKAKLNNNETLDPEVEALKLAEKLTVARWTSITKNTAAKVSSTIAVDGATIYVRHKEVRSKAATKKAEAIGYQLASTVVSYEIVYPSVPKPELANLTYVKGIDNEPVQFKITLNRLGNMPFETKVRNIKLGTRDIAFAQELNHEISETSPIDENKEYIITVTLDPSDLSTMANTYAKVLTINFENGSADKASVRLTVKNPSNVLTLTANASPGAVAGTTKVDIVSAIGIGNVYGYYYSATAVDKVYEESLPTLPKHKEYTSGDDIVTSPGYLVMLEINPSKGTIAKFKCVEITANDIAQ